MASCSGFVQTHGFETRSGISVCRGIRPGEWTNKWLALAVPAVDKFNDSFHFIVSCPLCQNRRKSPKRQMQQKAPTLSKPFFLLTTIAILATNAAAPATGLFADVLDPTNMWTTVSYTGPNQQDYFNDQQTGNGDADIVGNSQNAAFYVDFNDLGTSSLTDGTWYARVRLGSDRPQAGTFDNNLFIGIDANADGALDLFVGVDNQGANTRLAIWDPGTGANTSPSTTSIVSPAQFYTGQNAANYNFSPVSVALDPTITSFDLDGDGNIDWFLSFALDFSAIVAQMQAVAGLTIDQTTTVRYVLATSNTDNALNQDLNGANGQIGSSLTWQQLGVISNPMAIGFSIPEPHAFALLAGMTLFVLSTRRRAKT